MPSKENYFTESSKKIFLILTALIVLFLIVGCEEEVAYETSSEQQPECKAGGRKFCTTDEGYTGFRSCEDGFYSEECFVASLDDCATRKDELSNLCCKADDGDIYACNEKTTFKPGEYIILKVNLQKALEQSGLGINAYKVCAFSQLLPTETETPEHYKKHTEFSDDQIGCSSVLDANEFHQITINGIVPDTIGRAKLIEVRIYPETVDLTTAQLAKENIALSTLVFSFEVGINA